MRNSFASAEDCSFPHIQCVTRNGMKPHEFSKDELQRALVELSTATPKWGKDTAIVSNRRAAIIRQIASQS